MKKITSFCFLFAILVFLAGNLDVQALSFLTQTYLNPWPDEGDRFGYAVAAVGDNILVDASGEDTGASDAGAAYLLDGSTGAVIHTFFNPTPESGDRFGVSLAGVLDNVLVGAPDDNGGATSAGAAYLFDGNTGALLHTFLNPTPALADNFGWSVAGVGNNVIVGAPRDDTGARDSGAVYYFDGTTGALIRIILNPSPDRGDRFGYSVAGVANYILVGAPFDNTGAPNAGAAYLFDGNTGALLHTFLNPTPEDGEDFGFSVAGFGNDILVGAWRDNSGANGSGAVYLFSGTTGELLQTFLNPTPAPSDWFGCSVAGVGDNVLVGARLDDTGATDTGAAYLFDGDTGVLLHTFLNPTPADNDEFGTTVGSTSNNIIIGAYRDDTGANDAGAIYGFIPQANTPPTADAGDPYLGVVGESITFDGSGSSDPDNDPLTYAWDFGDSNTGIGVMPSHAYDAADIYDVCVTVNDGLVNSDTNCTIAVVYDPTGGFVTGGGWIYSEAGWCQLDEFCAGAEGKANFGFVSKYKKGATVPTGNTEFNFKAGGLNFHSSNYDWLVVNQGGANAQYKGSGTINGEGDYKFMLWAKDLDPDGDDTFRIKIWYEDGSEVVVYDNGFNQAINGGNIMVHTGKK